MLSVETLKAGQFAHGPNRMLPLVLLGFTTLLATGCPNGLAFLAGFGLAGLPGEDAVEIPARTAPPAPATKPPIQARLEAQNLNLIRGDPSALVTIMEMSDTLAALVAESATTDTAIDLIDASLVNTISSSEALAAYEEAWRSVAGEPLDNIRDEIQGETKELARAQAATTCTVVIYVNGIMTTGKDYLLDKRELNALVMSRLDSAVTTGFWNTSASDIEASFFGGIVCKFYYFTAIQKVCADLGGFLIDLSESGLQKFALFGERALDWRAPPTKLRDLIQSYLDLGVGVILVPHSQGNFFVRDALKLLGQDDGTDASPFASIGVVMLGSPERASNMPSRPALTRRVSTCQDIVVARFLGFDPSHACVQVADASCRAWDVRFCGHSLRGAYFKGESGRLIGDHISALAATTRNSLNCRRPAEPLVANAGPDKTISAIGNSVTLEGSATGGDGNYRFSWSPTTELNNANMGQPTASPTATTTYTLTVSDGAGAIADDEMTVTVSTSVCGNGICEPDENEATCFQDCNIAQVYKTVMSPTPNVSIFARDHQEEDGDKVDILVNGIVVVSNATLTNAGQSYFLGLAQGQNAVDIKALNEGSLGLNTAAFIVYDGNGAELLSEEWEMTTGQISRLIVIWQP